MTERLAAVLRAGSILAQNTFFVHIHLWPTDTVVSCLDICVCEFKIVFKRTHNTGKNLINKTLLVLFLNRRKYPKVYRTVKVFDRN